MRKRGEKRPSLSSIFTKVLFALQGSGRSRKAARFEKQFGKKAEWIRQQECAVWTHGSGVTICLRYQSEAAHVKSRGAGGTSQHLVPLCRLHHAEQHSLGIRTFEERYAMCMDELAEIFEALWQRIKGEV